MKKPSYSLNDNSLFFGLNETDFILLGGIFLLSLLISKRFEGFEFFPIIHLMVSFLSLVFFRLRFRRHSIRDFLLRIVSKRVQRVSKD